MRVLVLFLIFSLLISGCASGASASRPTPSPSAPAVTATTAPAVTVPAPTASATAASASAAPTATTPANTPTAAPSAAAAPTATSEAAVLSATAAPVSTVTATSLASASHTAEIAPTGANGIPAFDHIILILFENHNYSEVIGEKDLPTFNHLAQQNVLLTNYHAVAHPSLPNYIALMGGSTFGVTTDCFGCFLDQTSLPDLLEAAGKTWKTYQEGMPAPCSLGLDASGYDQNHDPFVYFNAIRSDAARCAQHIVPLDQLTADLNAGQLPNFAFIMPDLCNSGHNCDLTYADQWLGKLVKQLQASPALGQNSLIAITFDEASADNSACCGLPAQAGGRVATILISPLTKSGYQDKTPYSHYSLLKTILLAWNLPGLGETENPSTQAITGIWK